MYESYLHASMEERPIKVLVIMGSARKGNTYRAAERIREILEESAPVDWEYVMLKDVGLEQCRGCYTCFDRGGRSTAPSRTMRPSSKRRCMPRTG